MVTATHADWMALALSLSRRGLGQVWPNPNVGCVIVKDGRLVGRGWTQPSGRPHAEAMALGQAGSKAKGATAYVTLEPCSHQGQTPPCADALIAAGIAHVYSAMEDPDPRVNGRGHERLRAAGCEVNVGLLGDQAANTMAGFLKHRRTGLPFVTLKLAASFDGKIATQSGASQWITGPEARAYSHLLRASHDAILVGSGTVVADDPDLRVRLGGLSSRSPVRVVFDTKAKLAPTAKMLKTMTDAPVWMCHASGYSPKPDGVVSIETDIGPHGLDPSDALRKLASKGITRVFCEGGASLAASLLENRLVDQLVSFQAGIGIGADGLSAIGNMGVQDLDQAAKFELTETRRLGADVMSVWKTC